MSTPKRLTVEYDDGNTKTMDFGKIDKWTHISLAKLGLCPLPPTIGVWKHYALLEWDGWTEVVGIDADTVDLLRYYVIRRIDDRGRLSFEVGSEEPKVFVLERLPKELKGVIVTSATGIKAYDLSSEVERWEGIFEAGGKIEYVKYDKTREQKDIQEKSETVSRLIDILKRELTDRGLVPEKLLALEETQRIEVYWQFARAMGIYGKEKQEDLYGFIELLVKQLAAS